MNPHELIIDNFAGGGGASTGIELALGRPVDLAVNHDPLAVALHAANHPRTRHCCEDVFKIDPEKITGGRPVGLAWFSPDCKHFSKAKGGKPKSKKIRGLAWVVIKWATIKRPRLIFLENVEEFETWGPLLSDGAPCPKRKGRTFKSFVKRLEGLGYVVDWKPLRACDYGAPTIRKRLYLIARCDGCPIVWPAPTHADPAAKDFDPALRPWRTAAECIDWSLPTPSIFLNKRQGRKIGVKRPLAKATMRRLGRGTWKYVINAKEPFIVSLTHQGGDRVEAISEPFRTLTGAHRGEKALAVPFVVGAGGPAYSGKPRTAEGPFHTFTTENHAALAAAFLTQHANASSPRSNPAGEPMRTQCAEVKGGHFALVASHLSKFYGTNIGQRTDVPLHSITAQGNHIAEVRAFLIKYYGNEKDGIDLRGPIHTIPTVDRFGLITVQGVDYQISDIGMRMLAARELYRGQGFPETYIIQLDVDVIRNGKRKRVPLSQEAAIRMCGNSVCPPVAAALVSANLNQ